jgi:hypothetical protein
MIFFSLYDIDLRTTRQTRTKNIFNFLLCGVNRLTDKLVKYDDVMVNVLIPTWALSALPRVPGGGAFWSCGTFCTVCIVWYSYSYSYLVGSLNFERDLES